MSYIYVCDDGWILGGRICYMFSQEKTTLDGVRIICIHFMKSCLTDCMIVTRKMSTVMSLQWGRHMCRYYVNTAWMLFGCCVHAMLVLCGDCMDAMWMLCGCHVNVMWMMCGFCVDAMWMLCGWCVGHVWVLFECSLNAVWVQCRGDVGFVWMVPKCCEGDLVDTCTLFSCYMEAACQTWWL